MSDEQLERRLGSRPVDEVREGLAATKRTLPEQCEMGEDDDGRFRSIREPLPGGSKAAAVAKSPAAKAIEEVLR
jgi:hypothetical protein